MTKCHVDQAFHRCRVLAVLLFFASSARSAECDGTGSIEDCEGPAFTLGFEGCPGVVGGNPGEIKTFEVYATLETSKNDSTQGVQGWSISMTARGGTIREVSLEGINMRTSFDHDGDPTTAPVASQLELPRAHFRMALMAERGDLPMDWDPKQPVAVSAVALGSGGRVQLEPSGRQRIARMLVEVRIPEDGGFVPVTLEYVDGVYDDHVPLYNAVFFAGAASRPFRDACAPRDSVTPFRRGDFNSDGQVDISDPIATLSYLFLGGAGAGCLDAADVNNDGSVDISDPLFTLEDFFINPYPWSYVPSPGPFECGPDPRLDPLGCDSYPAC